MRTLETERLILRDWEEQDIGHFAPYSDGDIRYLLSAKNNYALVLKSKNEIVGSIGLNEDAEQRADCRNLGIVLLEEYWNQGLMSEALAEVIRHAVEIAPFLSYIHNADDLRSKHIAEKFGFQYVKMIDMTERCSSGMSSSQQLYYILSLNNKQT